MKKIVFMPLAFMAICLSGFAEGEFPIDAEPCEHCENLSQNLNIVNICNLKEQELKEIMQGQHPETAIEFSAQTTIPISLFLKGDLVNLVESAGKSAEMEVKQTFYFRCLQEEELVFSTNLTDWQSFLDFITCSVSVSLTIQDEHPSLEIGAELNRR
jgi:hypothetical protein